MASEEPYTATPSTGLTVETFNHIYKNYMVNSPELSDGGVSDAIPRHLEDRSGYAAKVEQLKKDLKAAWRVPTFGPPSDTDKAEYALFKKWSRSPPNLLMGGKRVVKLEDARLEYLICHVQGTLSGHRSASETKDAILEAWGYSFPQGLVDDLLANCKQCSSGEPIPPINHESPVQFATQPNSPIASADPGSVVFASKGGLPAGSRAVFDRMLSQAEAMTASPEVGDVSPSPAGRNSLSRQACTVQDFEGKVGPEGESARATMTGGPAPQDESEETLQLETDQGERGVSGDTRDGQDIGSSPEGEGTTSLFGSPGRLYLPPHLFTRFQNSLQNLATPVEPVELLSPAIALGIMHWAQDKADERARRSARETAITYDFAAKAHLLPLSYLTDGKLSGILVIAPLLRLDWDAPWIWLGRENKDAKGVQAVEIWLDAIRELLDGQLDSGSSHALKPVVGLALLPWEDAADRLCIEGLGYGCLQRKCGASFSSSKRTWDNFDGDTTIRCI